MHGALHKRVYALLMESVIVNKSYTEPKCSVIFDFFERVAGRPILFHQNWDSLKVSAESFYADWGSFQKVCQTPDSANLIDFYVIKKKASGQIVGGTKESRVNESVLLSSVAYEYAKAEQCLCPQWILSLKTLERGALALEYIRYEPSVEVKNSQSLHPMVGNRWTGTKPSYPCHL